MIFALGFASVLFIGSHLSKAAANSVLAALAAALAVHLTLSPLRGQDVSDKVKKMEVEAFQKFNAGDEDGAFKVMMEIQKHDPCNADVQYLTGLIAYANKNDGYPMIVQAANWGSGLAISWLKDNGRDCPCASSGGTAQTGKK